MTEGEAAVVTKECPRCAETIKLEALVCHFCHQEFNVRRLGYCSTCHRQVEVGAGTACPTCGHDAIDIRVDSSPLPFAPGPYPPQAPAPGPYPPPFAPAPYPPPFAPGPYPPPFAPGQVPPGPHGVGAPAAPYAPAPAVAAVAPQTALGMLIAVVGGSLMVAGSFQPWLRGPRFAMTGWDIYKGADRSGDNPFIVWNMFGHTLDFDPFVTGLTTVLIGGLAVLVALGVLRAPKKAPPSRLYVSSGWLSLEALVMIVGMVFIMVNVVSATGENASRMGVGIEEGFIVVVVGIIAVMVGFVLENQRPASQYPGGGRVG